MVIGGGNIFRGLAGAAKGIDRATADYMGMLATVMNALAMQAALERVGPAQPGPVGHPHDHCLRALYPPPRHPAHGKGPGGDLRAPAPAIPFFTTDTAAALRAAEMNCDAMLKATQVDGVYSADPKKVSRRHSDTILSAITRC